MFELYKHLNAQHTTLQLAKTSITALPLNFETVDIEWTLKIPCHLAAIMALSPLSPWTTGYLFVIKN